MSPKTPIRILMMPEYFLLMRLAASEAIRAIAAQFLQNQFEQSSIGTEPGTSCANSANPAKRKAAVTNAIKLNFFIFYKYFGSSPEDYSTTTPQCYETFLNFRVKSRKNFTGGGKFLSGDIVGGGRPCSRLGFPENFSPAGDYSAVSLQLSGKFSRAAGAWH